MTTDDAIHDPNTPPQYSLLNLDDQLTWVQLSLVKGLGAQAFCQLLRAYDTPENILNSTTSALETVVSKKVARAIHDVTNHETIAEKLAFTRDWLSVAGNYLITLADTLYPQSLLEIADPPPLLYAKGNLDLLNHQSIAMVGGRNATVQGIKNAEAFASDLAANHLCVVSGLALGIDGAAHRGALAVGGPTIAVVGTGLDIVYPAKHRDLAHEIVKKGLMISEFPLNTASFSGNFPRRNRIISGLSLGCLVVEANIRSGSQITARLAAEQGREVFAIPGSIHSPMAKGCHQLIKQGAKLVDCTQDIIDELKLEQTIANSVSHTMMEGQTSSNQSTSDSHPLIQIMGHDPMSLEQIVQKSGLPANEVVSQLMMLEIEGKVSSMTGGLYQQLVTR